MMTAEMHVQQIELLQRVVAAGGQLPRDQVPQEFDAVLIEAQYDARAQVRTCLTRSGDCVVVPRRPVVVA